MIDVEQLNDELKVSYWDANGVIAYHKIPVTKTDKFNWSYCEGNSYKRDSRFLSWDGKDIQKTPVNWINKFRIEEILQKQPQNVQEDIYNFVIPKKHSIDIECISGDGKFPEPSLAKWPINTIAVANEEGGIWVLGTKPLSHEEQMGIQNNINSHFKDFYSENFFRFNYIKFPSETDMLMFFLDGMFKKFNLITGWNVIDFDWQYIYNRCKRLGIDPAIASPSGKFVGKNKLPMHKPIVDYMQIVKKYDRVIDTKPESYSLDWISNYVLGIKKVKYNGTLTQLYEQDFAQFVFYNAVDTILVNLLDTKLNTMLTFLKLSNISKVEVNRAFSPVWVTEAIMFREFYENNKILISKNDQPADDTDSDEDYEGAYVKKPTPGIYGAVACFDFASLYPTTMRQFNIGPDTFIGKLDDMVGKITPETKHLYIVCASGAVFNAQVDSVFRKMLDNLYSGRKVAQRKSKDIEKDIETLKKLL